MQKTIKVLRAVLPLAFVAFIAFLFASFHRGHTTTTDKSGAEPVVGVRANEKPSLESKIFEDTQTVAGRISSHIRAQRLVSYSSHWNTLENVELTIYRPKGLTYQLTCPTAQFNSETKEADAKGGVKVVSSDGVEITTAEIHFDGNHLTNHIPLQFKIDRWTGTAGSLDLDVQAETLHLYEKIDALMRPEHPDEASMTIKGQDGVFRRNENDVTFTEHVVLTRLADRLNGDKMVAHFTQDRKSIVGLEGNGHIEMLLSSNSPATAGAAEDLGGTKQVFCDHFFSELAPTGQINAINCIGGPGPLPAHAIMEGPPRRDLVAQTFRIGLNGKVVTELKANDNVVMKEFGEIARTITGNNLTVTFDQLTHRAQSADIAGNFHYTDPKNDAKSVKATYDITGDRIVLTAEPGFDPTVVTDGEILKAKVIEFSPKAGTAKATGEVIAQLASKNSPTADGTNIFPANKPVFVNSDLLLMRQASKVAVFTGNVRAWQETNTLFAQELQVQGAGDQITARGNVRTVLYNTTPDAAKKTPVLSQSDQLLARKNDRRLDLTGNVKIDDDQRHLTSDKAAFFFDANRKLEKVDSEGKVVLLEQATGRKGTGDKGTYLVAKRMIYITGSPATATAPTGTLSGQQIAFDLARNKVEILSPTSQTQGTYKQDQKP